MESSENSEPIAAKQNGDGIHTIASKAEEMARELRDTARTEAEHRVHDLSEKAQQRIDAQRDRVASRIEETAGRVRDRGSAAGPIGTYAGEQVAYRLEIASDYLHDRQTTEIAGDFASYVKSHPVQSVIAAAFVGFLIGRVTG